MPLKIGLPALFLWLAIDPSLALVEMIRKFRAYHVLRINDPAHRRRANGVRLSTAAFSRRSVQPACSATFRSWITSIIDDLADRFNVVNRNVREYKCPFSNAAVLEVARRVIPAHRHDGVFHILGSLDC